MPYRAELAHLRQCEAETVERADAATDSKEQDAHFNLAAVYAAKIMAIEKQQRAAKRVAG